MPPVDFPHSYHALGLAVEGIVRRNSAISVLVEKLAMLGESSRPVKVAAIPHVAMAVMAITWAITWATTIGTHTHTCTMDPLAVATTTTTATLLSTTVALRMPAAASSSKRCSKMLLTWEYEFSRTSSSGRRGHGHRNSFAHRQIAWSPDEKQPAADTTERDTLSEQPVEELEPLLVTEPCVARTRP
ncbi:hypothetical protein GQ54DRAFT_310313 [Martensiomyces pterosporus]|nr:hypothetical protein GQ54DRAFT_310313 [Martensiomyces pterosporus]